jgi:hypothetical protein
MKLHLLRQACSIKISQATVACDKELHKLVERFKMRKHLSIPSLAKCLSNFENLSAFIYGDIHYINNPFSKNELK